MVTHLIISAIHNKRDDLKKAILTNRSKSVQEYTFEGAVAEAIQYHGACHIDVGIQEAAKAVAYLEDPGIRSMEKYLERAAIVRQVAFSGGDAFKYDPVITEKELDGAIDKVRKVAKDRACDKNVTNPICKAASKTETELEGLRQNAKTLDQSLEKRVRRRGGGQGTRGT